MCPTYGVLFLYRLPCTHRALPILYGFSFSFFCNALVQLLTFEEARAALASAEYPLFVQLCRPPLMFVTETPYPVVKLLCNLVLTNRSVEKVDGEFRCDVMWCDVAGRDGNFVAVFLSGGRCYVIVVAV